MNETTRSADLALNVSVNGQHLALPAGSSLADLIAHLGRNADTVATAVNGGFVARSERGRHVLQEGDQVACFQLIVGG